MDALRATLRADPGAHAYVELVHLYLERGDIKAAQALVTASLRLDPDHLDGRLALAQVELAAGRLDQAEKQLERVLSSRPQDTAATIILVDILDQTGRKAVAIALLRRKIRLYSHQVFVEKLRDLTGDTGVYAEATMAPGTSDRMPAIVRKLQRPPPIPSQGASHLNEDIAEDKPTSEEPMPITLLHELGFHRPQPDGDAQSAFRKPVASRSNETPIPQWDPEGDLELDDSVETLATPAPFTLSGDKKTPKADSGARNRDEEVSPRPEKATRAERNTALRSEKNYSDSDLPEMQTPRSGRDPDRTSVDTQPAVRREKSAPSYQEDGAQLADNPTDAQTQPSMRMATPVPAKPEGKVPPVMPANVEIDESTELIPKQALTAPSVDLRAQGVTDDVSTQAFSVTPKDHASLATPAPLDLIETTPRHRLDPEKKSQTNVEVEDASRAKQKQEAVTTPPRSLLRPPDSGEHEPKRGRKTRRPVPVPVSPLDKTVLNPDLSRGRKATNWPRLRSLLTGRILLLLILCVVSALLLSMRLQYRNAVHSARDILAAQRSSIQDGNYASRIELLAALDRTGDANSTLVRVGRSLARLMAVSQLDILSADRIALAQRIRGELATVFGEPIVGRTLMTREVENASILGRNDLHIAEILFGVKTGELEAAERLLTQLHDGEETAADNAWIAALVSQESGRTQTAIDRIRVAVRLSPDHPHAYPLLVRLSADQVEPLATLDSYGRLLDQIKPDHVTSQIGFESFRIQIGKRVGQAVKNLRSFLIRDAELSALQTAEIHHAIGHYHLGRDQLDAAQTAFHAAVKVQPNKLRFGQPLVSLYLRRYDLEAAENILDVYGPKSPLITRPLRAQIQMLKGQPQKAIAILSKGGRQDPKSLYLRGLAHLSLAQDHQLSAVDKSRALRQAAAILRQVLDTDRLNYAAEISLNLAKVLLNEGGNAALSRLRALRDIVGSPDERTFSKSLAFVAYGTALAHRAQIKSAENQFRSALGIDSEDYRTHWAYCQMLDAQFQSRRAIRHCRSALANPHFLPARKKMAAIAEAHDDHGTVVQALMSIVESADFTDRDLRRIARSLSLGSLGDELRRLRTKMAGKWTQSETDFVDGVLALQDGHKERAVTLLTKAQEDLTKDFSVTMLYADAMILVDRRDRALEALDWLAAHSTLPQPGVMAAALSLKAGQYAGAIRRAKRAYGKSKRSHAPKSTRAKALAIQGHALLMQGKRRTLRAAGRLVRRALKLVKDLPEALLAAGLYAEARGNTSKALSHFQRLKAVAPNSAQGFFHLGRLLIDSSAEQYPVASQFLERAIHLDPQGRWGLQAEKLLSTLRDAQLGSD